MMSISSVGSKKTLLDTVGESSVRLPPNGVILPLVVPEISLNS